jgi:4-carboxymuconolactone decarboxylase
MIDSQVSTSGRLPLLRPSELTETQTGLRQHLKGMLEWADRSGFRAQTHTGELLGPFNSLLYSPGVAEGLLSFIQAETRNTALSPHLREVVILTVGSVWNVTYELYAHRVVAQSLGMTARDCGTPLLRQRPCGPWTGRGSHPAVRARPHSGATSQTYSTRR